MSPKTARAECALRTRLAEAYLDGADNAVDDDADELRDAAVAQLRAAVDAAAPCAASRAAPPATRRAMESARNDARLALVKALGASYLISHLALVPIRPRRRGARLFLKDRTFSPGVSYLRPPAPRSRSRRAGKSP
jgi:hypothetical protein